MMSLEIDYIIFNFRRNNKEKLPENYFYEFGTYNILPKKVTLSISYGDDPQLIWYHKDYYFYKSFYWWELDYVDDRRNIKIISKCNNRKNIRLKKINSNLFYLTNNDGEKITKKTLKKYGLLDLLEYKKKYIFDIFFMKNPITKSEKILTNLWLEKRKIIEENYVITISKLLEKLGKEKILSLLKEIPEKQIKEWEKLGFIISKQISIKKIINDKNLIHLPLDTKYFDEDFKLRLISSFDNLDEELNGLLVHGENFQALNLLLEWYRGQVKCIYIDPPYNTGNDEFVYKDNYQHSSWLTMMHDRLVLGREWMREDGAIFVSIDDNEIQHLRKIGDVLWSRIGTFVWEKKKKGSHLSSTFRDLTEYVLAYSSNLSKLGELYGEKAYENKWQPLVKRKNRERVLYFPANRVQSSLKNGTYEPGLYGNGDTAVYLLDQIQINQGIIKNDFRLKGRFIWTQETLDKEFKKGSSFRLSKNMKPEVLRADQKEKIKHPPSLITKDIAAYEEAFAELKNLFGDVIYAYPKPTGLVKFFVNTLTYFKPEGIILDYFAGSGTTAHAVINLNREDGGKRKYILVEVANYFDTVLLPRVKKVVFSRSWKDGKPKPDKDGSLNGVSHFLKYIRLESYEDALNKRLNVKGAIS